MAVGWLVVKVRSNGVTVMVHCHQDPPSSPHLPPLFGKQGTQVLLPFAAHCPRPSVTHKWCTAFGGILPIWGGHPQTQAPGWGGWGVGMTPGWIAVCSWRHLWALVTDCCPSLEPFPSRGGGTHWPLPPSPCLAYPYFPRHPSFPLVGRAHGAPCFTALCWVGWGGGGGGYLNNGYMTPAVSGTPKRGEMKIAAAFGRVRPSQTQQFVGLDQYVPHHTVHRWARGITHETAQLVPTPPLRRQDAIGSDSRWSVRTWVQSVSGNGQNKLWTGRARVCPHGRPSPATFGNGVWQEAWGWGGGGSPRRKAPPRRRGGGGAMGLSPTRR